MSNANSEDSPVPGKSAEVPASGKQPPRLAEPILTTMLSGATTLFRPSDPGVEFVGAITNTAYQCYSFEVPSGVNIEYGVYRADGAKLIALSWDGPRTGRHLSGREVTAAEAAAEFLKDCLPVPAGLDLPEGAMIPLSQPTASRPGVGAGQAATMSGPYWFVDLAREALEEGYRWIAHFINGILITKQVEHALKADPLLPEDSLVRAAGRFRQALPGLRTLLPLPVSDGDVYPWSLGRINGWENGPWHVSCLERDTDEITRLGEFLNGKNWPPEQWKLGVLDCRN